MLSTSNNNKNWLVERDSEEPRLPSVMTDEDLNCNDQANCQNVLDRLNTLRRGGEFCDVILEVGGQEISAHRAVLASASTYLYELFSTDDDKNTSVQHVKLEGWDYDTFTLLINYAYTSTLRVAADSVRAVYKMATLLKMNRAAEACSRFLATNLKPSNCLGIRSFANSYSDTELTSLTDEYIQQNIDAVMDSPETKTIPFLQLNIIGVEDTDLEESTAQTNICKMVVEWVETAMLRSSLDEVINRPHVLYLTSDNNLRDCSESDDNVHESDDMVQDYIRMCKKRMRRQIEGLQDEEQSPLVVSKSKSGNHSDKSQKSPPIQHIQAPFTHQPLYKRLSNDRLSTMSIIDHEFSVIAVKMVAERCCMCLAMLDDTLTRLSLTLRTKHQQNGHTNGHQNGEEHLATPADSPRSSVCGEKPCGLTHLAAMDSARCGMGLAVINDNLAVIGGYDRGDCLATCEQFDMNSNTWSALPSMKTPRGRLDVSQVDNKLYACGGSDGFTDLISAEYLDTVTMKWRRLPDMKTSRSSAGVAVLNGSLYVLGGWRGQTGVAYCEELDKDHKKWNSICRMNVGRSQAAVCAVRDQLIVAGGSDSWNCLNSVELYCPVDNVWKHLPGLSVARRGAGMAVFKDKVYVVGGSDGTSSLSSVEIFDMDTQTWSFGPSLSIARANTAAIVYRGRLFCVGGFSGKDFLNTAEYLTEDAQEWCSFMPIEGAI